MARKFAAAVFSLGCIHASSSFALGLGELKLESFLNEPLKAEVDLLNTDGMHSDEIRIRLATREDFQRMGVERAYFLTSLTFEVNVDATGRGTISITSEDPVLEPYLDFIVEARWPSGRLLREYTVLVDPPLFDGSTPVVSATQRVAEVEGTPLPDESGKKPTDPAASSGTRVDVRKSDLAPGAMPQRDFNAETSSTPRAGSRYMIHRDDTLWQIAASAKPAGASVHQTMLDIQRLNPNAFIDGNINRIKAGYIVYLPSEGDISSQDLSAALAEVRKQNEDWEAGRASTPVASGPKLRISAEPVEQAGADAGTGADAGDYTAGGAAAAEQADVAARENAEMASELASVQQQVETLQRIVDVKDDQIAALQAALREAGGQVEDSDGAAGIDDDGDVLAGDDDDMESVASGMEETTSLATDDGDDTVQQGALDETVADGEAAAAEPAASADTADADAAGSAAAPAPQPEAKPKAASAPVEEQGGLLSKIFYGIGALILALLALFFVRRRKGDDDAAQGDEDDAFANVQVKEERVEVTPEPAYDPEPVTEFEEEQAEDIDSKADSRGYGERKHDEYASDVDTGDALAEADIYIAYGRYPQAKDLLQNALANEPGNTAYRLKLLETELQMGNDAGAQEQMRELEAIGDAGSIARARELIGDSGSYDEPPEGLAAEIDSNMEADFAGLEIEGGEEALSDDLDLSADFSDDTLSVDDDGEDLVIAAEANGMSTKLDLARAYMDMGDENGARQILEEVIAEGSEEQKAEAGALLDRIG
ncbi:FimV family protein [Pseudohalioglobus sediminis]|uniref:FimV family protein n=1 Tax=Pseudohalioglobus sediminis TaxID=2606449 RepID=A0A5B0X6D4_9GAMM|nr:FimV/HubP family polar landmark protein [Pseudohalioglobus sediminis]KAA1193891.1 FimV family protein [Pseudohalioglobus sediminis]